MMSTLPHLYTLTGLSKLALIGAWKFEQSWLGSKTDNRVLQRMGYYFSCAMSWRTEKVGTTETEERRMTYPYVGILSLYTCLINRSYRGPQKLSGWGQGSLIGRTWA